MKGWKNTLTACFCAAVVLAGVWCALLTDLRCRRDMGLPAAGLMQMQPAEAALRRAAAELGQAEWLLPPAVRGAAIGILWGIALGQERPYDPHGRKMLVVSQKPLCPNEKV